jgi:hypothetical protein
LRANGLCVGHNKQRARGMKLCPLQTPRRGNVVTLAVSRDCKALAKRDEAGAVWALEVWAKQHK